jgi:hypothetical protein
MTVFACAIASLALLRSQLWQFHATCIVIGLVGNGAAHLAYSRSISTWFQRRLGVALALVMVGAGLGAMLLPVFAQAASAERAGGPPMLLSAASPCYLGCLLVGVMSGTVDWSGARLLPRNILGRRGDENASDLRRELASHIGTWGS